MMSRDIAAKEWWSRRRSVYNVALVVAGLGAFFAYQLNAANVGRAAAS
jgi:hypothetical protein